MEILCDYFLIGAHPLLKPLTRARLKKAILSTITLKEVNDFAWMFPNPSSGCGTLLYNPQDVEKVKNLLQKTENEPPLELNVLEDDEPLWNYSNNTGSIKSTQNFENEGYQQLELSNHLIVMYAAAFSSKVCSVVFSLPLPLPLSSFESELTFTLAMMWASFALHPRGATEQVLSRCTFPQEFSLQFKKEESNEFQVTGACHPTDLEVLLSVLSAFFSEPITAYSSEEDKLAAKECLKSAFEWIGASNEGVAAKVMHDSAMDTFICGKKNSTGMGWGDVSEKVDILLDPSFQLGRKMTELLLSSVHLMEIAVTGNVTEDEVKKLLGKTLATIPYVRHKVKVPIPQPMCHPLAGKEDETSIVKYLKDVASIFDSISLEYPPPYNYTFPKIFVINKENNTRAETIQSAFSAYCDRQVLQKAVYNYASVGKPEYGFCKHQEDGKCSVGIAFSILPYTSEGLLFPLFVQRVILNSILQGRLTQVLRENMGGVYTVDVHAENEPLHHLRITFDCSTENFRELMASALVVCEEFFTNEFSEKEFLAARTSTVNILKMQFLSSANPEFKAAAAGHDGGSTTPEQELVSRAEIQNYSALLQTLRKCYVKNSALCYCTLPSSYEEAHLRWEKEQGWKNRDWWLG
eukprot:CAMPEP_0201515684 /NCGR_PEP_ID=MMETSP0161_2-20130828/7183_1 /ASSEMBLY_ACC=CAM_ASM_000251 /TAXON_ID=180227 /ORGANISM="Neoparamoeba aestuarina, Strain SoJaBio B1-5/56/2" /LENGTH=634 /DNA_ID=CAMNT_0047912583 /DNA_START=564 /DNA_END=2464 /DNA_ORIENTATION=+